MARTIPCLLAYVFWHVPVRGAGDYEERLRAFHASLRGECERSTTFALPAVPWLGGAPGYEDWYLVDDFSALGRLNDVAVTGARREPHDAAAAAARAGIAGVMRHLAGPLLPERAGWAAWPLRVVASRSAAPASRRGRRARASGRARAR